MHSKSWVDLLSGEKLACQLHEISLEESIKLTAIDVWVGLSNVHAH